MEENPFPDKKLPFISVQYLPTRKSIYGEPDGALLEDNQKIIGAVTRGMIIPSAKRLRIPNSLFDVASRALRIPVAVPDIALPLIPVEKALIPVKLSASAFCI
jgi:hypothetical protein